MSEVTLVDLQLEHPARRGEYVERAWEYLARVRDACRRLDPGCRVVVFGSFVKGCMRSDSDIDVLVITELARDPLSRGRVFREVVSEVGLDNPFELHVVTEEEYREMYARFIDAYREVA